MENKLDCNIVKDLMPSYVDGLTSDETNKAVENHLAGCEECSQSLQRMKTPQEPLQGQTAQLDYLKKVRRRSSCRSLIIGIILMLLGMSMLGYRFFYIGNKIDASEAACHVEVSEDEITISGMLRGGRAVSRITFSNSNSMVCAKIYAVPKTFFNSNSFSKAYTSSAKVEQVRVNDLIIWENGEEIGSIASQLFNSKNPFVGDMPSNNLVASILGVGEQFGEYKNVLQTSAEPYGWILSLETDIPADELSTAKEIMTADSYAMLACIENLGYVTWQYTSGNEKQEFTVSADDASAFAGQDIKLCGESASEMQRLVSRLSIKWSGIREVLQQTGEFRLRILNCSDEELKDIGINYYLNGKSLGSSNACNANGSPIKKGEDFVFEFTPDYFPEGTSALALLQFSFDVVVTDESGREYVAARGKMPSPKYAWTYDYSLVGNAQQGFVLNEG